MFLIDLKDQKVEQKLDWNTMAIDWRGRGADRGLRGIAIHNETLFIAASDELYAYNPDFSFKRSWRNQYLKHCHEIVVYQNQIFLTSTGFDSILVFDIEKEKFHLSFMEYFKIGFPLMLLQVAMATVAVYFMYTIYLAVHTII